MKSRILIAAACLAAPLLSGCGPAIVAGGAAVVAHTVVEERSTMDALRDTEIELGIENALMNHSHSLYGDVTVNVNEGRVLLVGSVPTVAEKEAASRIAWETEGVNAVDDEVFVAADSSTRQYFEDVKIGNAVRLRLLQDTAVASQNYDVVTFNRVVHLTGLARSRSELDRAIRHAQEVKGVTRVVSHVLTIDDPRRVRVTATTG
ncbi:MAG TPA: BON domain-containing protein [Thermohalobaculum sp.]|nr:BON domain-containing protein [Thermohalobaculum sp.]